MIHRFLGAVYITSSNMYVYIYTLSECLKKSRAVSRLRRDLKIIPRRRGFLFAKTICGGAARGQDGRTRPNGIERGIIVSNNPGPIREGYHGYASRAW